MEPNGPQHQTNPSHRTPATGNTTSALADSNGGGQGQTSQSQSAGGNGPIAGSHSGDEHTILP